MPTKIEKGGDVIYVLSDFDEFAEFCEIVSRMIQDDMYSVISGAKEPRDIKNATKLIEFWNKAKIKFKKQFEEEFSKDRYDEFEYYVQLIKEGVSSRSVELFDCDLSSMGEWMKDFHDPEDMFPFLGRYCMEEFYRPLDET